MGKYFGTDGVRGVANTELTPEFAFKLGRVASFVLTENQENPKIVIGRDTRKSGDLLENALIAGILSTGAGVVTLGVIPTPAVAYLTRKMNASAGVMISASHNPYQDNGIKFFGFDGFKLPDSLEEKIENLLESDDNLPRPYGENLGSVTPYTEANRQYIDFLKSTIDIDFSNLKIVLDCANGASSGVAKLLFEELKANVVVISDQPNGININVDCGSTHPEQLQKKVLEEQADIGLAFDGDADRLIAVDEKGNLIDGDGILFICGTHLKKTGQLKNDTVVSTVMSNLGFKKGLEKNNILTKQTKVGDRYVMEEMVRGGYNLGGEQSGHMIFLDHNTTGDGLLSAIQLVQVLIKEKASLTELVSGYQKFPQILMNVHVSDKYAWEKNEHILHTIKEMEMKLEGNGRILIRPSGTESLVRVMAEGEREDETEQIVQKLAKLIEKEDQKKNA